MTYDTSRFPKWRYGGSMRMLWPIVALSMILGVACGGCESGTDGRIGDASSPDARPDAGPDLARQVFVTSVTGNGNLSSWTDASGRTGLDAADAVCQTRASAAGWQGTFVAWLSDAADDAWCRVHGLSGKKSANCGQASLPATAGPWVRTDGHPWADRIDLALSAQPRVFVPLALDELGGDAADAFFSSTDENGEHDPSNDCAGWTSSAMTDAGQGQSTMTGLSWSVTDGLGGDCDHPRPIACFEVGSGPAVNLPDRDARLAFVTSATGSGDLSSWIDAAGATGLAAGDAICRARATAAALPGGDRFKAWLSDSTTDAIDRFADGAWKRVDGVWLAESKADLVDGAFTPINVREDGRYLVDFYGQVWTGTTLAGTADVDTCANWTWGVLGTNLGRTGLLDHAYYWGYYNNPSCHVLLRLYCLQD